MLEFPSFDEWQVFSSARWAVCVGSSCALVLGGVTSSCGDDSEEGEDVETWRRGAFSPCSSFCRMNESISQSVSQGTTQSALINHSVRHALNGTQEGCC